MSGRSLRKTARIDQILQRLGYATEEQIVRALERQRAHGGRIGENLVQMGSITEDQLLSALAEQFGLPTAVPDKDSVPPDLLARMPEGLAAERLVIPLAWNEHQRVLTLAVADPTDDRSVADARDAFHARGVRLVLAPESALAVLMGRSPSGSASGRRRVELPELFAPDEAASAPQPDAPDDGPAGRPVVMVSGSPTAKNFLPPVFRQEGWDLRVVATAEEASEAIAEGPLDAVLLSQGMVDDFSGWVRGKQVPPPGADVTVFTSVSGSLVENPLPYPATVRSLRSAVQALSDLRCAQRGASPPYGLIANDVEVLAERHHLRRIAADGLHLALHLLLPAPAGAGVDPVGSAEPFADFGSSLELATRISFPWRIGPVLTTCHGLFTGKSGTAGATPGNETLLAAQILALTWYRHVHVPARTENDEEALIALRTSLRAKAGSLAPLDLIESYLHLIGERGTAVTGGDRQVLLVGTDRITRALSPGLSRVGCQPIATEDLADAQTMADRRPPAAIVIDHDAFPTEIEKFSRIVKLDEDALLFALTDSTEPSLVLNFLDVGVDDVFSPPHDFDLMAARINRAIRSRARRRPDVREHPGQFSATFDVFSFLDLAQMLSQGRKTVRIELTRGDGTPATVYVQNGRMTHALCDDLTGVEAVYRIITWEDDGEFTVHSETRFPEATIELATESVLLEGCRRLDESRA